MILSESLFDQDGKQITQQKTNASQTITQISSRPSLDIPTHTAINTLIYVTLYINISSLDGHIFNLTWSTGVFPDKLGKEKVIPRYKSGDRKEISIYRPISILPVLHKTLEKSLHIALLITCKVTICYRVLRMVFAFTTSLNLPYYSLLLMHISY